MSSQSYDMNANVRTRVSEYHETLISPDTYITMCGSSKVEALHSLVDRMVCAIVSTRQPAIIGTSPITDEATLVRDKREGTIIKEKREE